MPITSPPRLLLASASPARLRTLQAAGIDAEVMISGVDESKVDAERPDTLCGTLARMKARAVVEKLRGMAAPTGGGRALVLGCDSVLAFDGEILGKPSDPADAVRRWRRMRGRSGVLHTGHCVVEVPPAGDLPHSGERLAEEVATTTVHFADVTDAEISAYVSTGEPLWVAGAFTIDGLGGPFVESIEGDPGTVIGLSLPLLRRLLIKLGLRIDQLWRPALTGRTQDQP